jgi:hypothetical protein
VPDERRSSATYVWQHALGGEPERLRLLSRWERATGPCPPGSRTTWVPMASRSPPTSTPTCSRTPQESTSRSEASTSWTRSRPTLYNGGSADARWWQLGIAEVADQLLDQGETQSATLDEFFRPYDDPSYSDDDDRLHRCHRTPQRRLILHASRETQDPVRLRWPVARTAWRSTSCHTAVMLPGPRSGCSRLVSSTTTSSRAGSKRNSVPVKPL